jgi:hypothetical protein
MTKIQQIGGSFRDPNGFVFTANEIIYRQVNQSYKGNYDQLINSGLYEELIDHQLLIPHTEVTDILPLNDRVYKVLRPEQVPLISYPYEWSFTQLKDAALATLNIQKRALTYNMTLKDASAYNIQFWNHKPLHIDTLSFEGYQEGQAWIAYRQFCQHFLAPLALMSYKDVRLGQLLRVHIDGIPLDLAASLLPKRAYLNLGIITHLYLHARAQQRYSDTSRTSNDNRQPQLKKQALLNIIDNLQLTIKGLKWDHGQTSWAKYYQGDSYQEEGFDDKQLLVGEYVDIVNPQYIWDLGANTGAFSRITSQRDIFTVSMDNDPGVVDANYIQVKHQKEKNLHPLLIDLTNPSSAIGWANDERDSLAERSRADCVMALALIHHLAISNNVPLIKIATYFASLAEWLIIEFVPKSDNKVKTLLSTRKDIFTEYTRSGFEQTFSEVYDIVKSQQIQQSERILYLLRRKKLP